MIGTNEAPPLLKSSDSDVVRRPTAGPSATPHGARPKALILGSGGRLGAALTAAFAQAGWDVVASARRHSYPLVHPHVTLTSGDLAQPAEILLAAVGASIVVHAINPIYTRWGQEVLPLGRLGMDIAARLGARFMLPGNVYNFGAAMPPRLEESTPQVPTTKKGRIRRELEQEIERRCERGELRATILRAGDFFGSGTGSWFDLVVVKSLPRGHLVYPSRLDIPHAWAYLPDLAQTFVAIAKVEATAPRFQTLHFAGNSLTGRQLLEAVERTVLAQPGVKRVSRGSVPWWLLRAGGILIPMWRELCEVAYLWHTPHVLADQKLRDAIGHVPCTPLDQAIQAALTELGLLKMPAAEASD